MRAALALFPAYLSIARAELRAEPGGDAGPPTGGEAASSPLAPPRRRAPPASAPGRQPARASAPAPRRRRPPRSPTAPQSRHPAAPQRPDPGDAGRAVSWQERVAWAARLPRTFLNLLLFGSARLRLALGKVTRRREARRVGEGDGELARALFMLPGRLGSGCSGVSGSPFPFPGARRRQSLYATQPRRALCQVCTAGEARSAWRQMMLPPRRRRVPAPGLSNCHAAPELNLNRE